MPSAFGSSLLLQPFSSRRMLRSLSSSLWHILGFSGDLGSARIICLISMVLLAVMWSSYWHCDFLISFVWDLLFGFSWFSCFRGSLQSQAFAAPEIGRVIVLDWFFFLFSRYWPYQILLYDILSLWSACYFLWGSYHVCLSSSLLSCASWYAVYEKSYADTCSTSGLELLQFNDWQYYMCFPCVIESNLSYFCLHK